MCALQTDAQPLLLKAEGCGPELVAEVQRSLVNVQLLSEFQASPGTTSALAAGEEVAAAEGVGGAAAEDWEWQAARQLGMLRLLPSAVSDAGEVLRLCISFMTASRELTSTAHVAASSSIGATVTEAVALLRAEALRLAAGAALATTPDEQLKLAQMALDAVRWVPHSFISPFSLQAITQRVPSG